MQEQEGADIVAKKLATEWMSLPVPMWGQLNSLLSDKRLEQSEHFNRSPYLPIVAR